MQVSREFHPNLQVSREFHPNFAAKWRRYLYIFPLDEDDNLRLGGEQSSKILQNSEDSIIPQSFDVAQLDKIVRQLMGKTLSYRMFARDTQASRSV
jgi:tRNA U38,U39,U40 pseudouridine synthase TruA